MGCSIEGRKNARMPILSVFPNWNTNPYLNLLFLEPRSSGWAIQGGTTYEDLILSIQGLRSGDVLHIQWTSPFAAGIRQSAEYFERISKFKNECKKAKSIGVRVFWTVHNIVAHSTEYLREEIELARTLADLSDRIIILNSRTALVAKEFYELPNEKLVHLPHSSYDGIYPPASNRAELEKKLGIVEGLTTLGLIGAIRSYKGTSTFIKGASIAARKLGNSALIIAGETNPFTMKEIEDNIRNDIPIYRKHTRLSDAEMSDWVGATDIMVLPYKGILNSGSMHLAATFNTPVVLPNLWHLREEYSGEEWVLFYDEGETQEQTYQNLSEAIVEATQNYPARVKSARSFAERFTPFDMTRRFNNILSY